MSQRFLITGGAGFIGSAVVRQLVRETDYDVCVVDKLTYAGNLNSLAPIANSPRYSFVQADVADAGKMADLVASYRPDVVMHLAAESHVDRSIDGPAAFILTNIIGTYALLEAALAYWRGLPSSRQAAFRFHHISTDEVFGSLDSEGCFTETTAYDPRSPYSASKAASDHLVRSWHHTYGLPVLITNCSNNYGPYHFPEKLIRLTILNGLEDELRIVVDQHGSPTAAREVAEAILNNAPGLLPDKPSWGTYHFAAGGVTSWWGFASRVVAVQARISGHNPRVIPIQTAEYPTAAKRPGNSQLDCGLFAKVFGFSPRHWTEGVDATTRALAASSQHLGSHVA